MPLPSFVARSNRFVLNPIIRRFAGKIAPLAVLIHHGRKSGKAYRTPIMAFPTGSGFVIALTYGRNTDWERNVLAHGGCALVYRRARHELRAPEFIGNDNAGAYIPAVIRVVLRLLGVHDFLRLRESR